MSIPILELMDVHAAYGRIEVVRGVDLVVPRGAVLALLGPNGAGKSTLLKVISGRKKRSSGDIHMAGVNVQDAKTEDMARLGLTTIPEGRSVFPNLSVQENLLLVSYAGVPADKVLDTAFTYFPRLEQRRRQLAGTLSGGEQQMCAIGRGLMARPSLLLIDELSLGLAPRMVEFLTERLREINKSGELYETVAGIAETGVSILVVEQFARTALRVADYAAVMVGGRIVATGEPDEINEKMSDVILGGAA
jgi:branched-chain amino acid transport system ATP-binding protein